MTKLCPFGAFHLISMVSTVIVMYIAAPTINNLSADRGSLAIIAIKIILVGVYLVARL